MQLKTVALGVVFVIAPRMLVAEETPAWINVPNTKAPLHFAVPLAEKPISGQSGLFRLTETDHAEVAVLGQRIAAMAADGTAAAGKACLAASISPGASNSGTRRFRVEASPSQASGGFSFREVNDKSLELLDDGKPVLVYNHGVITNASVPKNDARRNRACFVHPLYGLNGEVLTDSFPKDHYHHHGIFWAWSHIVIDGQEYDLWVSNKIEQRFVRWICRESGPVAAVLAVENGWFVGDKKVMIERIWFRAYRAHDGARPLDITLVLIPVDRPITLRGAEGKSYGGINLRFAPRTDTVITVPTGRTTEDLPDTRLAWADLTARFAGAPGPSGAALFVDPKHPDFPPPWLTRHYGILCCGYPGVQGKTFPAGEPVRLNYRVWIHQSAVDVAEIQRAFEAYGVARALEDGSK